VPLGALAPAYVLSELKAAFQIGAVLFLPFLIIDLVVASVTLSVGMVQLPPVMVSAPFKILLFVWWTDGIWWSDRWFGVSTDNAESQLMFKEFQAAPDFIRMPHEYPPSNTGRLSHSVVMNKLRIRSTTAQSSCSLKLLEHSLDSRVIS